MIKKSLIALACATALTTTASAGNVESVTTEPPIIVPATIEPTGSLNSSSGAILPIALGVLVLAAAISSSGGS